MVQLMLKFVTNVQYQFICLFVYLFLSKEFLQKMLDGDTLGRVIE